MKIKDEKDKNINNEHIGTQIDASDTMYNSIM
jgi:hypothetical protein